MALAAAQAGRGVTGAEKGLKLSSIQRRFESGAWDDLDVKLLLSLARAAVNTTGLGNLTDEEFALVERVRKERYERDAESGAMAP
jgi:hypothetical protein